MAGPDRPDRRADRPGPVARLFGSLANALIDLGLPTIREWLRDRIGPAADVAQVTTDGSFVHLDGVRVPIGPRGLLVLDRATAAFTALGRQGLPEMRLHAFRGMLTFGDGKTQSFRADVSFTASPNPEEAAWIWGELAIHRAMWSPREGSEATNPMHGRARLFVTSREWRIDGGRLDGEIVRAHFTGSGIFEKEDDEDDPDSDRNPARAKHASSPPKPKPLVPDTLTTASLKLEHARVGAFVDAASGLVGQAIAIPSFVPLDAQLDGDLSWSSSPPSSSSSSVGGTDRKAGYADLRIVAEAIQAHVRGSIGAFGDALSGRIEADVRLATLLRSGGGQIPITAIPRDEDVARIELDVGGELTRPEVNGTISAREIGFRLGRPRFVPALILRNLKGDVFVKDERAVLRAEALARSSKVTVDVDAQIREPLRSVRGTLRADAIEAGFLRDVIATLGAKLFVPEGTTASLDFMLTPTETATPELGGTITLATPPAPVSDDAAQSAPNVAVGVSNTTDASNAPKNSTSPYRGGAPAARKESKLALVLSPTGALRLTGGVTTADVMATGVFAESTVYPTEGDLIVALDITRNGDQIAARGTAAAGHLALALRDRPDVPPYVVHGASVNVVIDRDAFVYERLRFHGYGGRFVAKGTVPFPGSDHHHGAQLPRIDLELEEGGAELAEALARLIPRLSPPASPSASTTVRATSAAPSQAIPRLVVSRAPNERPKNEIWLPPDLLARGTLQLEADASLNVDVAFETPAGSAFDAALRLAHGGGALDGSRLRGAVALSDLISSGAIGAEADVPIAPEGVVEIDAVLRGHDEQTLVTGWVTAPRLALRGFVSIASAQTPTKTDPEKIALPSLVFADVTARFRVDRHGVMWSPIEGRAYRGSFSSEGRAGLAGLASRNESQPTSAKTDATIHTRVSLVSIAIHELPPISGHTPAAFVRGDLSGSVALLVEGPSPIRATGEIVIDAATFPALNIVQPTLARYGLRPPNEDATGPVTAKIVGNDWGMSLREVKLDLHGASLRGEVGVSAERTVDGHAEVTLEEEYLRTSKLLTLPRVLTERLVLPVTISGPLDRPDVHADLGECLGRFLKDNRVRQFVTSAVEEAQILLGRHRISDRSNIPDRPIAEPALEQSLREAIDAHAADWEEIAERQRNWAKESPRARPRISTAPKG